MIRHASGHLQVILAIQFKSLELSPSKARSIRLPK